MPAGAARTHLLTNMDQYPTRELAKSAIERIRRTQASISPSDGANDMSALAAAIARADSLSERLDAFVKGAKGLGKKGDGKGPGKSGKPTQLCPICQKGYHWKQDCWQNAAKGGKAAGKAGKPAGKAGAKSGANCFQCGKTGHQKKDCRSKPVHAFADDNDADEELSGLFLSHLNHNVMNAFPPSGGGKIRLNIDSGRATTAVCKNTAPEYPVKPCAKDGKNYTSVPGHNIKVEGEVEIRWYDAKVSRQEVRHSPKSYECQRYGTGWTSSRIWPRLKWKRHQPRNA